METGPLLLHASTVSELIRKHPKTIHFLIARETSCVGCYLAGFCSLADVVETYRFDQKDFYEELEQKFINPSKP